MLKLIVAILVLFCVPSHVIAAIWSIEAAAGGVYNIPIPLKIKQHGYRNIDITAHYETKPFTLPPYYVIRLGRWIDCKAWEVEFIHHKLYLKNKPKDVKRFTITNGYNLITVNRAWSTANHYILRVGLGAVLAHPESIIHGHRFNQKGGTLNNSGYYVAGPTGMASLAKRFYFCSFFLELEGKLTASYAYVKIARGHAHAPNVALHGTVGIGYDL